MVLPINQLLHLGPDPSSSATWNHFNLGLGLSSHVDYAQSALGNSPPQGQPWFYSKTNPTSGKDVGVFSAPFGGATTSTNTQYARCELREFERDGTTKMAFDPRSGDHWIEGIYRIYGLSGLSKPGVCVQQMHDPGDDVIMVRTELESGATKLVLNYNGTRVAVLNSSYADGTEFYLKTRVNAGTPSVYYTTNLASIPTSPTHTSAGFFSGASTGWYSKTGSYNQTNENTDPSQDPDASIIRVEIRELKHWHSATPAGGAWPTPASYAQSGGTTPVVSAGADAQILPSATFNRTASVTLNGATLTSQQWKVLSGPSGAGNVLSSTATVAWAPSSGATGGGGVPVGQTEVFKETFDSGLSNTNYSAVQTHSYEGSPSGYNLNSEYRMQIVNDPSSATVLRTEVHDGDTAVGSHERCEISSFGKFWNDNQNDERWYEFDVKFETMPSMSGDDWLIFYQWHNVSLGDAPPLAMALHADGKVYFEREPDSDFEFIPVWTPTAGTWYHVVAHIKWSPNPSTGFIQCHVNGTEVVTKRFCRTQYTGDTSNQYVKFGQYRRSSISGTSVVKHDNLRVSTLPAVTSGSTGGYPNGTYVLQYIANTSAGTFTDTVTVVVTPTPTDPGTGGTGGGGTPSGSIGTYPSNVSVGPAAISNGSTTVTVLPPPTVSGGQFQVCIIQLADEEDIPNPIAGWELLDEQNVPNTTSPSKMIILRNTNGDSSTINLTKSGSGGYHAVRMAWKDWSALGQHLSRGSSDTTTPYSPTVTPGTDKALVVTIMGSDRGTASAAPVTVPTGWTSRYNSSQTINTNQFESIAVAEIQVDNKAPTGANLPSGTGVGTSNFTLTNSDNCSMFSFVLEGAVSTGISFAGAANLAASAQLRINYFLPPVPAGAMLLTALPQLIARTIVRGGVNLYALSSLNLSGSLFPRGAFIILPNLTFAAKQQTIAALLLLAGPVLRAGALPYRRPVLRTDYKYPPINHPFRLIAQRVLDGEIIEWELPVSEDFQYTEQLSGPVVMQGSFRPELIQVQELGLDGYAYWLHVEINQEIRASAILLPPQYQESEMSFSAEGVSAMPHYHYFQSVYRQIQVDPFSVVRSLWNYIQSQPESDLGVIVSNNSSPARLGEPATTETTVTTADDGTTTTTTRQIPEKPYELLWWEATNIGEELDTLSGQVPFDFVERHSWNADRTDVLHFIDLGYPRLGVARPNLLFNEENILEAVPVQEPEDTYASAVLVIGAGDGEDTIRGYAAQSYGDRIRKEVTVTDKTIKTVERANARALSELAFRRGRTFEASEIVVNAYHPNAPIGSYSIGDDIQVQIEVPWLMVSHTSWYRIISIQNKPSSDKVRLGLARSDTLLDTSDIWIAPDDYVPFTPPPPIGAVAWNGNVHLQIQAILTVVPPVPVPTARVFFTIVPVITVNGAVFGGSFAFVNNLFTAQSLTIGGMQTLVGFVALPATPSLVASGISAGAGFGTVTMIIPTTLLATTQALAGAVSMTATPNLSALATGVFATNAALTATPTLTAGAVQTRTGAVSLSATPVLTADGTVSSGTTITQLGNTADDTGSSSSSANKTVVSKFTASVAGTITAGHARLWMDTGTSSVKMCVYSDSSGSPNSLLGLSDALTVSNTTEALKDFTFSGVQQAAVTAGTDYWIGFTWADPGTNSVFWSRGTTASQAQQNSLNAASSFGTPGTALSGPIDAYVDVSSSSGGGGGGLTGPGTSPALVSADSLTSVTTSTFNVPANSVLVAVVGCNHYGQGSTFTGATFTMSNNGAALSWSQAIKRTNQDRGAAAAPAGIYVAPVASARTGLTVTVSLTAAAGTVETPILAVYVIPGADLTTPVGGTAGGFSTTNNLTTGAVTMSKAGSLVFVGAIDYSAAGAPTSSDLTISGHTGTIASAISWLTGWELGAASGATVTSNLDAPGTSSVNWTWVAAEIRSA